MTTEEVLAAARTLAEFVFDGPLPRTPPVEVLIEAGRLLADTPRAICDQARADSRARNEAETDLANSRSMEKELQSHLRFFCREKERLRLKFVDLEEHVLAGTHDG